MKRLAFNLKELKKINEKDSNMIEINRLQKQWKTFKKYLKIDKYDHFARCCKSNAITKHVKAFEEDYDEDSFFLIL